MNTPLRVLIIEDSEDDVLLLLRELRRGGYEPAFERVETAAAMRAALEQQKWDLVIADYSMPRFSGLAALTLLQESGLDLPFILVSEAISQGAAVEAMKAGARDYVLKDDLARLIPVIERELREAAARRERKWAQEALRNVAEGVSAKTGEAFFRLLVQYLGKTLEVDYAFIGELADETDDCIKTIAVCAHGEIIDNFEYNLKHTPCEQVVGQRLCYYPQNVQQDFPLDHLLVEMGIESYIGTPLFDSAGRALGIMVVLDGKPLQNVDLAASMLQIFAVRASAELERRQSEKEIHRRNRELALLNRIIAASAATPNVEPEFILQTACRELALAFDVPQAAAMLLSEGGGGTEAIVVAECRPEGRPSVLNAVNHPAVQ
ncbi:MAG: response regulator, partial [Anaerolineae bacterium]